MIKRHKNFIPILFLAVLCLWTTYEVLFVQTEYQGELHDKSLSLNNILAFIAIGFDIGIYYFGRKYFRYAVIVTVIAGLIGILSFTITTVVINFIFPFEGVSFGIGLVYIIINYKRIMARLDKRSPVTDQPDPEKIENFKNKYRQDSIAELEAVIADKRFITEARLAANQLLEERNK